MRTGVSGSHGMVFMSPHRDPVKSTSWSNYWRPYRILKLPMLQLYTLKVLSVATFDVWSKMLTTQSH